MRRSVALIAETVCAVENLVKRGCIFVVAIGELRKSFTTTRSVIYSRFRAALDLIVLCTESCGRNDSNLRFETREFVKRQLIFES